MAVCQKIGTQSTSAPSTITLKLSGFIDISGNWYIGKNNK